MLPKKKLKFRLLIILFLFSIFIIYILANNVKQEKTIAEEKITEIITKAEYMQNNEILGGKVYYISSDGTSSVGTDINNPMSLQEANKKTFYGDDKILFKRGDIFYGTINFNIEADDKHMVYIGTYGDENLEKPIITVGYCVEDENAWKKVDENIYVLDMSKKSYLYGYLTNYSTSYNIGFFRDEDMNIYENKKSSIEELENNFDFYCDDKYIYVKSMDNPVRLLGRITLGSKHNIVTLSENTILDGLIIQDTGAHGIVKKGNAKNIYIKDCVIQNIGGSILNDLNGDLSRYGNGIEFWNQAENTIVQNCIIKNVYDAAYTLQGSSVTDGYYNNVFKNNIIINCTYPIEFSCHNGTSIENCNFEDTVIEGNLIINQGQGFGYDTRPKSIKPSTLR